MGPCLRRGDGAWGDWFTPSPSPPFGLSEVEGYAPTPVLRLRRFRAEVYPEPVEGLSTNGGGEMPRLPTRLPGEGRGPVGRPRQRTAPRHYLGHADWTPAFAGEWRGGKTYPRTTSHSSSGARALRVALAGSAVSSNPIATPQKSMRSAGTSRNASTVLG